MFPHLSNIRSSALPKNIDDHRHRAKLKHNTIMTIYRYVRSISYSRVSVSAHHSLGFDTGLKKSLPLRVLRCLPSPPSVCAWTHVRSPSVLKDHLVWWQRFPALQTIPMEVGICLLRKRIKGFRGGRRKLYGGESYLISIVNPTPKNP